jgi:hypothetical protein
MRHSFWLPCPLCLCGSNSFAFWSLRRLFIVILLGLALAACQTTPTATFTPSPTLPPGVTPSVTATVTPSASFTPTATAVTPSRTPTKTATPTKTTTPRQTATPTPPPLALGAHVFGLGHMPLMRSAGMTWLKLQIRWDGSSLASAVRPLIDTAHNGGLKILLSVVGNKDQLAANRAAYIQQYAAYVAALARLNPDAIEVWNEPNIDREWPAGQISGTNYAGLLIPAYNVLVISGAPAPTGFFGGQCATGGCDDDIFIRQMQQAGAGTALDCVGVHYNEGLVPPDRTSGDPRGSSSHYSRYFKTMIALYTSVFPNKPLCFTEIGYLTDDGLPPLPPGFEWAANTTLQNQADWLALAATIARADRLIQLMIVWNLDSPIYNTDPMAGFAIRRTDGSCPACITLGQVMGVQAVAETTPEPDPLAVTPAL